MIPIMFLILFTFFLSYLYFGIYILFKNWQSLTNRLFFLFCLNLSAWALGYAFMTIALDQKTYNFWRMISSLGWCLVYSTWLDFAILVKTKSNKWMTDVRRLMIYLPSAFFFIANVKYNQRVMQERFVFPIGIIVFSIAILGITCLFYDIIDYKNSENISLSTHRDLEKKVYKRTKRLVEINIQLEEEILVRIKAEKDLISSEEKFRALMKQSSDGIIVFDQDTRKLVESNEVAYNILGISEEQMSELIAKQNIKSSDDEVTLTINEIIENDTMSTNKTIKYTQKNGICRDIKFSSTYVGFSNKQFIMITMRDLTDELIMQERKRQKDKMESLGTLSGGIAHDFNNILTGIMGYTQLTLEELEESTFTTENLIEVLKLGERAKKLISQILSFSKNTLIIPGNIDLSSIIEDNLKMLKATLPNNIDIDYRRGIDTFYVYADQGELHQLIMNLFVNAIMAMSKSGGTLQVTLAKILIEKKLQIGYQMLKIGEYIKLDVMDTGCGIEESVKKRIFEPFFTTRESQGGTGLGLSVVHGIVNRFEGVIMVDSEPDIGSTFTVYLPAADKLKIE